MDEYRKETKRNTLPALIHKELDWPNGCTVNFDNSYNEYFSRLPTLEVSIVLNCMV